MVNKIQNMTPKEIVAELDKYIIGQNKAKRSVAIALRNRYRRNLLSDEMREEITPKNILMIGPTGCGKTEIARRLAKLMDAPFVKVEATKFTEVGYVGRDVDSMVRDLVEASVRITKKSALKEKYAIADRLVEEKILDALINEGPAKSQKETVSSTEGAPFDLLRNNGGFTSQKQLYEESLKNKKVSEEPKTDVEDATRAQIREQLHKGLLEDEFIEIEVEEAPKTNQLDLGNEGMSIAIGNIFGNMPKKKKNKNVRVRDARKILREQEAQKMLDMDQVTDEAVDNAEQNGIIFIDEIDKIASGSGYSNSADVSREGVQRDILPIVEGSVVNTKYGPVKTDHILFIGAGAFHVSKPTDLIPELQGRFPIKVELKNLDKEDFKNILTVPENAIIKQNQALLATEQIKLEFSEEAIDEIATMAYLMNEQTENIGARRLYTIMEQLLDDVSYEIPQTNDEPYVIDREYVRNRFIDTIKKDDLDKYIL